ncbi:MAG TPA: hypothetical protein VIG06_24465 [Kofleriaceae bacterium]
MLVAATPAAAIAARNMAAAQRVERSREAAAVGTLRTTALDRVRRQDPRLVCHLVVAAAAGQGPTK